MIVKIIIYEHHPSIISSSINYPFIPHRFPITCCRDIVNCCINLQGWCRQLHSSRLVSTVMEVDLTGKLTISHQIITECPSLQSNATVHNTINRHPLLTHHVRRKYLHCNKHRIQPTFMYNVFMFISIMVYKERETYNYLCDYMSYSSCWVSFQNGLIWTFVVPVLLISTVGQTSLVHMVWSQLIVNYS